MNEFMCITLYHTKLYVLMERPSIIISYKYNPSILQLTILNERGRIWTMVAGGGASVIYADTIVDMGGVNDLANYGKSI